MRPFSHIAAFSFMIFALLTGACRHDPHKYMMIDPSLKSAYDYKAGSYWIYKDSISGRIDSFVVTGNKSGFIDLYNNTSNEQVIITMAQYNILPHDADSLNELTVYLRNSNQFQPIYTTNNGDTFKLYNYAPINYPFTPGQYISSSNPQDTITTTGINAMNVNGNTFYNVAAIGLQNTYMRSILFQFNDIFYINETQGIVKISMDHNPESMHKRWEIMRWNIIK